MPLADGVTEGGVILPNDRVVWTPQPGPQTEAIQCPYYEVFYGGAAGGGKTDFLLGDFSRGIEEYGDAWHGVLFRRSFPDLGEVEKRSMQIFAPIYGADSFKRGRHMWEFKTAKGTATLRFGALNEPGDEYKFLGFQFTWLGFDELTLWPDDTQLELLMTRVRSPAGAPCSVRCAANPGQIGHDWVKKRYGIDQPDTPPRTPIPIVAPVTGEVTHRIFIPAKVTDNRILLDNDPGYLDRLDKIANPTLRRAMRDGDWNVVAGAAFPEFNKEIHVIPSFRVPPGVYLWRSMDWGFDKPYCCLWGYQDYDANLVICGELYGYGGKPNVGSREDPEAVWERIREIEAREEWLVTRAFLDPQCWAEDGTTSIHSQLGGDKALWEPWPKGRGSRASQISAIHHLMRVVNGRSRLRIMDRCVHLIRTISTIPVDKRNTEDVDTNAEDHPVDALRGIVSSQIFSKEQLDALRRAQHNASRNHDYGQYGGW